MMNLYKVSKKSAAKIGGTVLLAIIFLCGFVPNHSYAAGGLLICGSQSQEYSDAQQVNQTGGSAASLTQFNTDSCQFSQLFSEIIHLINWLIASAGFLAVFWIVIIGFKMVIYAGDAGKIKTLKSDLNSVLVGLIIIMLAFIFVNTLYSIFNIKINGANGFLFNPFSGQ